MMRWRWSAIGCGPFYDAHQATQAAPGAAFMDAYAGLGITLSGVPIAVTLRAIRQIELVRKIEPNLDDDEYVMALFAEFPRSSERITGMAL